jgi:hypothetical protein
VTCLPFHGIHGQTCTGLHWNPVHEALRISSILGPHLEDLEILMYDLGPGFPGLVWQTEIESTCSISIPLSICSDRTGVHCIHVRTYSSHRSYCTPRQQPPPQPPPAMQSY